MLPDYKYDLYGRERNLPYFLLDALYLNREIFLKPIFERTNRKLKQFTGAAGQKQKRRREFFWITDFTMENYSIPV